MLQTRALFLLAFALVFLPLRADAAFILPGDAVLEVHEFTFPAGLKIPAERNLPTVFHALILRALEDAGLTGLHEHDAPPAAETQTPGISPLTVTPLAEDGASLPDETAKEDQAAGQGNGGKNTGVSANAETNAESDSKESADTDANAETDTETSAESDTEEEGEDEEAPGKPLFHPLAATHILEGNVTFFRETVGNPTRIAGDIRIRAEASIHCAYRVRDAKTGRVLISSATSGSSARIASQDQELDAVLETLGNKAMADAAAKMAARLAGTETGNGVSDRSYYQDSPGKRLKP